MLVSTDIKISEGEIWFTGRSCKANGETNEAQKIMNLESRNRISRWNQ